MKNDKIIFTVVVLFLFLIFSLIQYQRSKIYNVLSIKSPFEIVVDKNKNTIEDDDEVVSILNGYQYISREDIKDGFDFGKYKLSKTETIAIAYLTEKFMLDNLKDKRVTIKKVGADCQIFVGAVNFNEKLLNSGLIFKDYKPVNEKAFKTVSDYIKHSDLVLYNAKSNKYHKLDCKYGLMAHNYVCVSRSQLPKGAKFCKFCSDKGHKPKKVVAKHSPHTVKPVPITISNGSIKILITDYTGKMKPDRNGNTEVCNELVNLINNAQKSIDIAIYGYDKVPKIENALKKAIARGVKVRLVYDIDSRGNNIYADTMYFVNLIKNTRSDKALFESETSNKYTNLTMHNKFYIFDDSIVVTGSANMSFTDMSGFNSNNVIVIHSKQVAEIYKQEFEQMYSGKFHYLKQPIQNKENLIIGNSNLSVYFSPTDSTIEKVVVPLIDKAKKYIYIPTFLITDKRLAQAIINAKDRGVKVKVIVDATNARSPYSKHRLFRQHGIPVKTETFAGKLHTKTIIIDDYISIMGSMNLSKNGEKNNDENVVVIKNSKLAVFNRIFFEYLWQKIDDYWLTHDANAEGLDSPGSCSDGIDNDYDGKTDMEDEGCRMLRGKRIN